LEFGNALHLGGGEEAELQVRNLLGGEVFLHEHFGPCRARVVVGVIVGVGTVGAAVHEAALGSAAA